MQRSKNWFVPATAVILLSGLCAAAGTVEAENTAPLGASTTDAQVNGDDPQKTAGRSDRNVDFTGGHTTKVPDANACDSDLDGDGTRGFGDLLRLLNRWGTCEGCEEDFDGNGQVSFADLINFLNDWGPCS